MIEARAPASDVRGGAEPALRRYSAFISYTNADRAIALKLQARLERYRLPPRLARQVGYNRIKPVFVDRSEMRAESDLADAVRDALGRSDFLIVLCTPRTPASRWVGIEIDAFRELRGDANILVALFDGNKADCFHPHLLTGSTGHPADPLAADFRRKGDGNRLALLKLMASLVGVNLDDLIHRDARRQRKLLLLAGSTVSLVALLVTVLSYTTYHAKASEVEQRIAASRAMERQLDDLRAKIRAGGTLDMAAAVNRNVELFYDGQPDTSSLPEVELGRAKLLQAKAEDAGRRGDLSAGESNARAAWKVSSGVLSREPSDTNAIYSHAQSAFWVGYFAWRKGDTPLAANAFGRYADLADKLVKADPANPDWLIELGDAYSNLGTIALINARDVDRAERYFKAEEAAYRSVVKSKPNDWEATYELVNAEALLSEVERERGDYAVAERHLEERAKLLDGLLAHDPRNQIYRTEHVASQIFEARLQAVQGKIAVALRTLQEAHREASDLVASDPELASAANRLRMVELFEAQFELAQVRRSPGAVDRSAKLLGDCKRDWEYPDNAELGAFCSLLSSHISLLRGKEAAARQIMADKRLAKWLGSPSLTPLMLLDFPAECRKLGDPGLCD